MDITLLNVLHGGLDNAELLRPYVTLADVMLPERFGLTHELAAEREEQWKLLIAAGATAVPEGFWCMHPVAQQAKEEYVPPAFRQSIAEYSNATCAMFLAKRAPLIYCERYDESELLKLVRLFTSCQLAFRSLHAALDVDKELAVSSLYNAIVTQQDFVARRDKHIGANIGRVESLILNTYPSLRIDHAHAYAHIGHAHRVEQYTRRPLQVVSLTSELTAKYVQRTRIIEKIVVDEATFKDVEQDIAAYLYA